MRLQVNLIPALAYALVTMFSNLAGLTVVVEKPSKKQQIVSLPVVHHELNSQHSCVLAAKNGQLIPDSFSDYFPYRFNAMDFSYSAVMQFSPERQVSLKWPPSGFGSNCRMRIKSLADICGNYYFVKNTPSVPLLHL
ncbi:MAG: hypothetical protein M0Q53_05325 [Prolixibacteraceae bacterium]|jgi:hypothetical protein|nr:hypothetical protein [Prolixibacteraceae bacterium]